MSEQPLAYEEVPGGRTLQQAVEQPQRVRWAYEELQAGDLVQDGDQWLNPDGRWQAIVLTPEASMKVGEGLRVRRPHSITMMLAAFANQAEVLTEVRADEKRLFDDLELLRSEYVKLQVERDKAHTEAVELEASRRKWIDRYNTEISPALQVSKQLTEARAALKSAQRARDELQRQVDELRDLVNELHGSVDEIADAGTAADVKEMLCTWATELDYSSDCFDAVGKSQLDIVQKTLITAIARIEIEFGKEATSADA